MELVEIMQCNMTFLQWKVSYLSVAVLQQQEANMNESEPFSSI